MELDLYLDELKELVSKSIANYESQIVKIAIGRANPALVSKIKINYYDSQVTIDEVASIQPVGALQLVVKPYDIGTIKDIEKAINDYKLNLTVVNEGHQLRLNYPQLTTDKRKEFVKQLNLITEQARVNIRQARQDVNKKIKNDKELSEDIQKHYLDIIQTEITKAINKIEDISANKEKELMTI
ncbi:ribosome-recycling factor [Metamycoplasma orale]|jgi:ribosome recycling factor|uniref:Ribosome recycling factor n=1 Tax=Metamycoplasma orale TaxID=2121 RepID=A0A448ZXE9_METOS|nr:ribosome-recycling factor [Metamycoplasma orale]VEU55824.1 ribosome recycling factor [Metamycoplasma orale]